jgi:4-aminobutyrate aminotransferase/(S)-3-amino-2-methylpropionate transaminase
MARRARRFETPGLAPAQAGDELLTWSEARGANVLDLDGNRFLDFTSGFGVAAVGHRHPAVVAALRRQMGRLIHGLGDAHGHGVRVELAARLAAVAPMREPRVAFAVSGADAVELAAKTAVLATGRSRMLAFRPSYHGLTLGALALTSRRRFRAPFTPHLHRRVKHLPYGCDTASLRAALADSRMAAVVVEPIVGREGVILPPAGWLTELSALCRHHGTLLIADEILTGCGRTGRWFAVDHDKVEPDLLCVGKALTGGMPLAAVVGREPVMAAWDDPGEARHAATFTAQPLACAAAVATLGVLRGDRLIARSASLGRTISAALDDWPERFRAVRGVRGRGALWGIEWQTAAAATAFAARLRRRGLLLLGGGEKGRVSELLPPLTITERQLEHGLSLLEATAQELPLS